MRIPDLSLVIQAGGASSRMGKDKGLLLFHGQPLVQRLAARLGGLAQETLLTTNRPEEYARFGLRMAGDLLPGLGALSGLYTALHTARFGLVAVVACDMPFASPALLARQADMLARQADMQAPGRAAAVVPLSAEGRQVFHAVYRREICLPLIENALNAGKRRVDAWFDTAEIYFMPPAEVEQSDPQGLAFVNVNTPEELAAAERLGL